jgi:MFS family permease
MLYARQERVLLSARRLWVAVAGLSVDQLVAWGVLYYAYTALSAPIAADLGVSRLHVAAAFSICLLIAGWGGRHVGPILDARGTRGALRLGAIAAPLVFAALALVGGMVSLVVVFALLGIVQAVALYEPAFRTIVDWCPEERTRSRAMLGLTIVGGFASTVFLPLTTALLSHGSWRETVLALAAVLAVVLVPMRFLLPLSNRGHARTSILRLSAPPSATRLATGLAMHSLASTGVFVYLMWHLVEQGETLGAAAAIAGVAGAAQVPGRIVSGPLRRVVGGAAFLPLLLGAQAVALLGVVVLDGGAAQACVLVFGAASGMMTLERATIILDWYGRATFGAHQGRLAAATSAARAASPFVVEAGHHFASYAAVFGLLAVLLALGAWTCRSAAHLRALETAA